MKRAWIMQNLHQRVRVCKALLSLMGYSHHWGSEGPPPEAKKLLDEYGGPMSKPQWTLYQVVWYVWGRPADVKVQEIMQLPAPHGPWVMSLLESTLRGSDAVEAWLREIQGISGTPERERFKLHRLA